MAFHAFRHAVRSLSRTPRFCLVVVTTLALAVGGSGALLSLLNAVVLRDMPVREPERLIVVFPANGAALFGISFPTLKELAAQQQSMTAICGTARGSQQVVEINGVMETLASESVTGECHRLLGLEPALGRLIEPEDTPLDRRSEQIVVVSHAFWQSTLGGAPTVIGQTLRVQNIPLTIVGVLPEHYRGLSADEAPDIVLPLGGSWRPDGPRPVALHLVGRLRDGISLEQARAHLKAVWPGVWKSTNPDAKPGAASGAGLAESLRVESLRGGFSDLRQRYAIPLYALVALAALLVLLACINVGGLFLARAIARERETSVQIALGAERRWLALQRTAEGVMLSMVAAALALPIAWWASRALAVFLWTGTRPLSKDVTPDAWTIAAIALAGVVAGLVVSLPQVSAIAFREWQLAARESRGVFAATARWRHALMAVQVALSLVLLFCAGLFIRNVHDIRTRDLGYDRTGIVSVHLSLVFGQTLVPVRDAYSRQVLERVAAAPNVSSAAFSGTFPWFRQEMATALIPIGRVDAPSDMTISGRTEGVSPGFFATSRIPLLAGREFTWLDTRGQPDVAIISQPLAEKLFPDGNALGKTITLPARNKTFTVVGIAADVAPGDPRIRNLPTVYRPAMQEEPNVAAVPTILLRATNSEGILDAMRAAIEPLGRHTVREIRTLDHQHDRLLLAERALTRIASAFAVLGAVIAALGLYAVLSFAVARRTKELGLRMTLGASQGSVMNLVIGEGLKMALVGLAVGLPLAFAAGRAIQSLLSGVSPYDPLATATVVAALMLISLTAAAIPAMRAARTQPAEALRTE